VVTSIDELLDRCLSAAGAGTFSLTLDPGFQGLPDTAHGGSVLAVFDRLAHQTGAREVLGVYRRRVPPGVPLRLDVRRPDGRIGFTLRDDRATLVEGYVTAATGGLGADVVALSDGAQPLPLSRTCFACGTDNPIGLRLALRFDDHAVRGEWDPRDHFATRGGTITPAALTTLLDETAFWLGALATGESGMTTEIRVRLRRPAPFGARLIVSGRRADVVPLQTDSRYWRTLTAVHDAAGALIASGSITFVAVRGAAKRLIAGILAANPPAVVRRVFPAYA
jgi:acyl-coenzyme A thioesterase PaaI-like protein